MKFSELRQENRKLKEHLEIANRVIDIQGQHIEENIETIDKKDKEIQSLSKYEALFYLSGIINIGLAIILLFVGAR